MFFLPEPASAAGAMSCPSCGAAVGATASKCEYCATELLVKACPRCFARIFHGAKHCRHCGAKVDVPAAANPDGTARELHCPRCDARMVGRLVGDVLLDECEQCYGIWLDQEALTRLLEDRESEVSAGLHAQGLHTRERAAVDPGAQSGGRMYVKCPECDAVMNRRVFARGAKVIVDQCKAHGTWFDAGELPLVMEFVASGGLGEARRRELEDLKDQQRRAQRPPIGMDRGAGPSDGLLQDQSPVVKALGIIARAIFDT